MALHPKINTYDVFYSNKTKHYYVCVYNQEDDGNNGLTNDIYGLIITTNQKYRKLFEENKNDYNVEVCLNGVTSYICCDKLLRISNNQDVVLKPFILSFDEIKLIDKYLNKFINEIKRQTEIRSVQNDNNS